MRRNCHHLKGTLSMISPHTVAEEYDKTLHMLVVPSACIRYILHQVHDVLGHNVLQEPINVSNGCIIGKTYKDVLILM